MYDTWSPENPQSVSVSAWRQQITATARCRETLRNRENRGELPRHPEERSDEGSSFTCSWLEFMRSSFSWVHPLGLPPVASRAGVRKKLRLVEHGVFSFTEPALPCEPLRYSALSAASCCCCGQFKQPQPYWRRNRQSAPAPWRASVHSMRSRGGCTLPRLRRMPIPARAPHPSRAEGRARMP